MCSVLFCVCMSHSDYMFCAVLLGLSVLTGMFVVPRSVCALFPVLFLCYSPYCLCAESRAACVLFPVLFVSMLFSALFVRCFPYCLCVVPRTVCVLFPMLFVCCSQCCTPGVDVLFIKNNISCPSCADAVVCVCVCVCVYSCTWAPQTTAWCGAQPTSAYV